LIHGRCAQALARHSQAQQPSFSSTFQTAVG
jgi:hypothetical protein